MEDSASRLNEGPHQRLKILFIPMWYPDDDDPSAGVFIQEHARAAALFNDVRVLFVKADRSLRDDSVTDSTEDGIMVRRVRYSTWRATDALGARLETVAKGKGRSGAAARYAATFLRGARSAALSTHTALAYRAWLSEDWKPDVIHAHIYGAGFPAVFIGKICSTPVVVSEHLSTLAEEKLNWFEKFKAGFVARRADAALPVSPILAEELAHLGARNVTIIPNVVDIGDEGTTEEPVAPVGALAITSSGDVKGLDVLVESVEAVSRERSAFRLTVVGAQAAAIPGQGSQGRGVRAVATLRFPAPPNAL
jgi:glycosyltransferase involved in cell wall biosynthesis